MSSAKVWWVAVALAIGPAVAWAQDVHTSSMPAVNFSSFKTYYWAKTDAVPGNDIVNERIMAAVDRGMAKLAKELLPAIDHLELALKAAEGHEDVVKGFQMVAGELQAALNRVGIQTFSPKGEAFDPNEHEAMAQQPLEGAEPGTVIEVYQSGYRINGAVLRPARVVVAG